VTLQRATALLPLLGVLVLPGLVPEFWVTLLSYIGMSALVTVGLVLLTGIGGQTSFGQAAFAGVAAYVTAVLSTQYAISPWLLLPLALGLTALAALLLGLVTLRLDGHYLPLGTIGWGISIAALFGTLPWLGGFNGMSGVPGLALPFLPKPSGRVVLGFIWLLLLGVMWLTRNLLDSRHGRAIRALNGGRLMAESMGVDTARTGLVIFVIAAVYAGLAGWLYAQVQGYVNPTPFSLTAGIEYLFMAIVGGAGWLWGGVLGSLVVTVLRDQLNDLLPRLLGRAGNFEAMAFAALVVLMLQRAPNGLWPMLLRWVPRHPRPNPVDAPVLAPRTTSGATTLAVTSLTRRFGGLLANQDISFAVNPGEIVALIGPNGAGKSTLFNLVTGVMRPSAGTITLGGQRIDGLPARRIARLGVARTFQHVRLLPERSVLDNVALGAHLRGHASVLSAMLRLDRGEERRLLAEAARQIARVGLGAQLHTPAGDLALGQQRVAEIARALCLDPALLLLDEPAAGLRLQEKQHLATLLMQLRADGMAVLLVEHDMDFVMGLADRVVVLDFGRKIAEGRPEEVQRDKAVLDAYLGGVD
jgi:branched-chain amino acid transport system permease protein